MRPVRAVLGRGRRAGAGAPGDAGSPTSSSRFSSWTWASCGPVRTDRFISGGRIVHRDGDLGSWRRYFRRRRGGHRHRHRDRPSDPAARRPGRDM